MKQDVSNMMMRLVFLCFCIFYPTEQVKYLYSCYGACYNNLTILNRGDSFANLLTAINREKSKRAKRFR